MYIYENLPTIFQINFPKSQANKLVDLRYTVYELTFNQSGNDVNVYINETNNGIVETTDGAYQIELTLPIGKYSINWNLLNTPYVGNEEINVIDNMNENIKDLVENTSRYSGYGD